MKIFFSILFFVGGIIGGLYVGGWLMFAQSIIEACKAFDAGTLTALMVGMTVIKCVLAGIVGGLIAWVGSVIAQIIVSL